MKATRSAQALFTITGDPSEQKIRIDQITKDPNENEALIFIGDGDREDIHRLFDFLANVMGISYVYDDAGYLDHPHSCPLINDVIKEIKKTVENYGSDICSPVDLDHFFNEIKAEVERIREENTQMRDKANTQIKNLQQRLKETEEKCDEQL